MTELLERPRLAAPEPARRPLGSRWRRWVRTALKPLIVVGIAGTLAVSLTVTTTQKAEANPLLIPPVIMTGASIMTVGEVAGATAMLGPIGWGLLGLAAVGVGLYYTKDYWLPYITGDFGKGSGIAKPADGQIVDNPFLGNDGNVRKVTDKLTITQVPTMLYDTGGHPYGVTGNWLMESPTVTTIINYGPMINCKTPSGNIYAKESGATASISTTDSLAIRTKTRSISCSTGEVMTGYFVAGKNAGNGPIPGPTGTAINLAGNSSGFAPKHIVVWGDMWDALRKDMPAPTDAFDPKSPLTKYTTTVECIRADGTKFSLNTESTGDMGGVKVPSCSAAEAGAHGTGKMTVVGKSPDGNTTKTLLDRPAAPGNPSDYPLCSPAKPGPGCALSVWVDGKECVVGNWNCAHWKEIDQTRVQCSFGPYVGIAIDSCNPLERAYEEGGVPATEANTDGNTATRADTDPNGNTVPKNSTGTGTGTQIFPSTGTNPGTQPGTTNENCLATGWSWDPVSWVMVPVQCAMQWAFVPPRTRLDATVQAIQPRLEAKGIEPFIVPFMANFGNLGGAGCKGPAISIAALGINQTLYPFDACQEPLAPVATGVNAFFSLSIILQGGMSCIRGVAAAFGFNWGFGGGKDED